MNENKKIDNPRIKIVKCVGAKAQNEKMRWNNIKINKRHNFQNTKFSVIDLVLTQIGNHSGTRPKSACGKSSSRRFSFPAARNAITKATEYVTFGFSFRILVFFSFYESLNVTVCKQHRFFSVSVALILKNSDKRPWIENGEGFAVHSSTWPSSAKGEWRVSSLLAISNAREKDWIFF